MSLPPTVVPRAPPWLPALAVLFAPSVSGFAIRRMRGAVTIVAAACVLATSGGVADAGISPGVTKTRTKVTFELRGRTGYEYEWKYHVLVRVRSAAGGIPLRGLRVVVSGAMSLPGHEMAAVPTRLAPGASEHTAGRSPSTWVASGTSECRCKGTTSSRR